MIHESSINYQNLIRDLAEMYPFDVAEVVIVELIANALDAKATKIAIDFDPKSKILVIEDNGDGMSESQFEQYHDFAVGLKTRGTGIGFAGLGAKISFNIANKVITETRSKTFTGGSNWYLKSKNKLIWEETKPVSLNGFGTRVEVRFSPDAHIPYSTNQYLIRLVQRHYLPLLDLDFLTLYQKRGCCSNDLRFVINGHEIKIGSLKKDLTLDKIKEFYPQKASKRIGYGVFGLASGEYPLGSDISGVLLCTWGKVIKAGFFNQFPGELGPRIFGIVEIPDFINFLTTSKTDFIRGWKHKELEKLYDPIRREFKAWLEELGMQSAEIIDTDETKKLENELKKIINEVPELSDFLGFRTNAPVYEPNEGGTTPVILGENLDTSIPDIDVCESSDLPTLDSEEYAAEALEKDEKGTTRAESISRKAKHGPKIAFYESPEKIDLSWIEGSKIIINSGHPCFYKVRSNVQSKRIHCLFAIANAVQKFLPDKGDTSFIDRMMKAWGEK